MTVSTRVSSGSPTPSERLPSKGRLKRGLPGRSRLVPPALCHITFSWLYTTRGFGCNLQSLSVNQSKLILDPISRLFFYSSLLLSPKRCFREPWSKIGRFVSCRLTMRTTNVLSFILLGEKSGDWWRRLFGGLSGYLYSRLFVSLKRIHSHRCGAVWFLVVEFLFFLLRIIFPSFFLLYGSLFLVAEIGNTSNGEEETLVLRRRSHVFPLFCFLFSLFLFSIDPCPRGRLGFRLIKIELARI